MPRDIRIQPNRSTTGSTQQPTIYFSGTTGASINLKVEDDGSIVFEGNNGGLFNITDSKDGLLSSVNDISGLPIFAVYSTDKIIAGGYNQNALIVDNDKVFIGSDTRTVPTGTKLAVSGNTLINGTLTATTISATTYQNLPLSSTTYVTGFTYSSNTFTIRDSSGSTFNTTINTVTGLTVNGNLSVTGNTTMSGTLSVTGNTNLRDLTGTTGYFSGSGQSILTIIGSGSSTSSPLFTVQGSSGELFSVTDSLSGSLFSVNDISGLPILEVFSDNTILMGSYLAPSLNTTKRLTLTAGTNTVYSIPTSAYTGAFFDYTLISSGSTGARAGTIMSIWSGSTAQSTDVSTNDIGTTTGVTFSVAVSGSNAVLSSSATTAGWTVKTIIRSI